MTTELTDEQIADLDLDDPETQPSHLRAAADRSKGLAKQLRDVQKELVFTKAGIDIEDPKGKFFFEGYKGENDVEKVKAQALELGFVAGQNASQGQEQTGLTAEQQAIIASQGRTASASQGSTVPDTTFAAAKDQLQKALNEGGVNAMMEVARSLGVRIATE